MYTFMCNLVKYLYYRNNTMIALENVHKERNMFHIMVLEDSFLKINLKITCPVK